MNIFKGLLFLHGYINPADYQAELDDQIRHQFGAASVGNELARPLGNGAESRRRFGPAANVAATRLPEAGCVTGGCG